MNHPPMNPPQSSLGPPIVWALRAVFILAAMAACIL